MRTVRIPKALRQVLQRLASEGGKARAAKLSKARRAEIARLGGAATKGIKKPRKGTR